MCVCICVFVCQLISVDSSSSWLIMCVYVFVCVSTDICGQQQQLAYNVCVCICVCVNWSGNVAWKKCEQPSESAKKILPCVCVCVCVCVWLRACVQLVYQPPSKKRTASLERISMSFLGDIWYSTSRPLRSFHGCPLLCIKNPNSEKRRGLHHRVSNIQYLFKGVSLILLFWGGCRHSVASVYFSLSSIIRFFVTLSSF